jgi:hypothetical protein
MKKICTGSGIIPIIQSYDNKYYFILFKSIIRKKSLGETIEDCGGEYEGNNIKISAIRELKEESSLLFNLENMKIKDSILLLNKVLSKFNVVIDNFNNEYYVSHFVYLENKEKKIFDLNELKSYYINNLRNFWKNGFSVYTENKDIVFIPIESIINNNTDYVNDHLGKEYKLFERTYNIFKNLKSNNNETQFIKILIKYPICIDKKELSNYKYKKGNIDKLITFE